MRIAGIALALALAAPRLAHADEPADEKPTRKPKKDADGVKVDATVDTRGGVLTGEGTVRERAGFARVGGKVTPEYTRDRWSLRVPVAFASRETFGATFPERSGDVDPELRWKRDARLHVSGHAGLSETWRPGWPDPYQPLAGGGLATTSRRSHFDAFGGVEVGGIPVRHHHARLSYDLRNVDYTDDDAYDPVDAPTHLVPGDHVEHELKGSWTYHGDDWKLGGVVDAEYQRWAELRARDARTGLTHAGAGGPPPNPLQGTFTVEPAVTAEVTRGPFEIDVSYGVGLQSDLYEGYYSYVEQHPELDLKLMLPRFTIESKTDLRWRTYGANSYAENPPDHPMLDFGDRRSDRTLQSSLALETPIGAGLALIGGVAVKVRRSNFPDYVPGVFPMTRQYDIDWDYDDVTAFAGLSWARGLL